MPAVDPGTPEGKTSPGLTGKLKLQVLILLPSLSAALSTLLHIIIN
jgi:hypothetical protein